MRETGYLIVGGGPAGCAAAIALMRHNPSADVLLVEANDYTSDKPGESLHASALPLLEQLGIRQQFIEQGFPSSAGFRSYWGTDAETEEHGLFSPRGNGWHLERNRFDEFLSECAKNSGAAVLNKTRFSALEKQDGRWMVNLHQSDGKQLKVAAKKIIDATGRKALVAKRCGAVAEVTDNLCAVQLYFTCAGDALPDRFTQIEATQHGWWYSALLPQNRMAVAFFSDAETINELGLRNRFRFLEHLQEAKQTAQCVRAASPAADEPQVFPAMSQCIHPPCGKDWVAVGDAACTFDPLSGQGMVKALRTGIYAAYAMMEQDKGTSGAAEKYNAVLKRIFGNYRDQHTLYYADETRWQHSSFWKMRAGELTIHPATVLSPADATHIAQEERCPWMSTEEWMQLKKCIAYPQSTALEVLSAFRAHTQSAAGDRRALLALQWLAETGHARPENHAHFTSHS